MQVKCPFVINYVPTFSNRIYAVSWKHVFLSFACFLSFLSEKANAQAFEWVKAIVSPTTGRLGADVAQRVAVDGNGNVYMTGYIGRSPFLDFNPGGSGGILINTSGYLGYLVKYDAAGNFLWAKLTKARFDHNVAVDSRDNVYVIGRFFHEATFSTSGGSVDTLISAGYSDVLLTKYDGDGNYLWAKCLGGKGVDQARGIAIDGNDNVCIVGTFKSDTANLNPGGNGGMLFNSLPSRPAAIFVAKYDSSGNFRWAKGIGGEDRYGIDTYWSGDVVTMDSIGNVYLTGHVNNYEGKNPTIDFNPGGSGGKIPFAGGAHANPFLVKYDAGGSFRWAKIMEGGNDSRGHGLGVAVDRGGNVYAMGVFGNSNPIHNTIDLNPGSNGGKVTGLSSLSGRLNRDMYLVKYDSSGNFLWAKGMGGENACVAFVGGIALDISDNVYVTGRSDWSAGTIDLNHGNSGGQVYPRNGFAAKYNSDGNLIWANGYMGNFDIAVTRSGIYLCGVIGGPAGLITPDFNPGGSGGKIATIPQHVTSLILLKYACSNTSSSYLTASATCGKGYVWNDSVYREEGIYTQVFPNLLGCDSTATLDLVIYPIEKPVINVDSFVLGVTVNYATYQWLLNSLPIPGATTSTHSVTENGNYQVVVTDEFGCSNSSDVYPVNNSTGIKDVSTLSRQIRIYPNPAFDVVYIQSPVKINTVLMDVTGRVIYEIEDTLKVPLVNLVDGIYLLQVTDASGTLIKVEKVVKQAG